MENHSTRIILITGPKHSGKTSVGRVLAELLGAGFIDLDELIEQQTGKIPRTLYKEGPEIFRQAETRALASLLPEITGGRPRVVAAGGGLIDNPSALELLQDSGAGVMTICLEITADTAWDRISMTAQRTGELPPFLNTENPRETHAALHKRRGAAYRAFASLTLSAEGKTSEDIGREIADLIERKDV
ncbi:shikimate kinase [Treponema primitia]|uniref:shikimate kinase n=1 Tax=Treponema primitia TaxID=88058 RepID=UPI003980298E